MQAALKGRSIWAERRNKADYLQSRGLSVGRGCLLLKFDSDDTKHWNDSIVAANNVSPARFLSAPCGCSMDVQGDYDPCDASGFIRINAVRSDSPHPLKCFIFLSFFLDFRWKVFYQWDFDELFFLSLLLLLVHRLREHHRLQGLSSTKKWTADALQTVLHTLKSPGTSCSFYRSIC